MRALAPLVLLFFACTAPEVAEDGGQSGEMNDSDAAGSMRGGGGEGEGELPVRGPYVLLQDVTEGVTIGADGPDIDAVTAECGGTVQVGIRSAQAEAVGEPDGEGASIGAGGLLMVDLGLPDLRGCTVRVYEVADRATESYRVHLCSDYDDQNACVSIGKAGDGETFEQVIE